MAGPLNIRWHVPIDILGVLDPRVGAGATKAGGDVRAFDVATGAALWRTRGFIGLPRGVGSDGALIVFASGIMVWAR